MQIKTNNLTQVFGFGQDLEHVAINRVSLKIDQQEFVGIIGHTGSGKTTLIEHLNGLLVPTYGEVEIISNHFLKKQDINNKRKEASFIINNTKRKLKKVNKLRRLVGLVFQFAEYQLFESTIEKEIIFGPLNMGIPEQKALVKVREYIQLVGLDESFLKRSPFDLSGGQKRRVALASILAMDPEVLILDEPTAGLDPEGVKAMYEIFAKLHKQGKTIIIITHNLDEMLEYAHRILIFNEGRIVEDGFAQDVLYQHQMLIDNQLQPPKLVELVDKLEKRGIRVGKPRSIQELVSILKRKKRK
ncbi:MAG: energy-coupling factor transporter ATPase [Mycoplasma sp.]|nr:energy-coupling factor transporter ATPase [Mycoplasma sp.]